MIKIQTFGIHDQQLHNLKVLDEGISLQLCMLSLNILFTAGYKLDGLIANIQCWAVARYSPLFRYSANSFAIVLG